MRYEDDPEYGTNNHTGAEYSIIIYLLTLELYHPLGMVVLVIQLIS
jgi:hypothetical protein